MQSKPRLIEAADKPGTDLNAPAPGSENSQASLRAIVKEALLGLLSDPEASAAAKASAGRTLLEYFSEEKQGLNKRGAEMTAAELNDAIERFKR
jgi:hypothetical protein